MKTYTLTKLDVAAIRRADQFVVRMHADGVTRVTATQNGKPKSTQHPFGTEDRHHDIGAYVYCYCGWAPVPEDARPVCFEMMYLYRTQTTPDGTILFDLRAGDEVSFQFAPDYGSSQTIMDAGLYADALLLHITRGKRRLLYVLATQISPNNTARMIRGVPDSAERLRRRMAAIAS